MEVGEADGGSSADSDEPAREGQARKRTKERKEKLPHLAVELRSYSLAAER
jgi:hypothetical protein